MIRGAALQDGTQDRPFLFAGEVDAGLAGVRQNVTVSSIMHVTGAVDFWHHSETMSCGQTVAAKLHLKCMLKLLFPDIY